MANSVTYPLSFKRNLRLSRYFFRVMMMVFWLMGVLLTTHYITDKISLRQSDIYLEFNQNFIQLQGYINRLTNIIDDVRFVSEHSSRNTVFGNATLMAPVLDQDKNITPQYHPLFKNSHCEILSTKYKTSVDKTQVESIAGFIRFWRSHLTTAYDVSHVFFLSNDNLCMVDFPTQVSEEDRSELLDRLRKHVLQFKRGGKTDETQYWVFSEEGKDKGQIYVLVPIYIANRLTGLLGIGASLRLSDFVRLNHYPTETILLTKDGQKLLHFSPTNAQVLPLLNNVNHSYYSNLIHRYSTLVMQKPIPGTSMNIVYALPASAIWGDFSGVIILAVVMNILCLMMMMTVSWLFERRVFTPAERHIHQLEEYEDLNRKIVSSAPVGICIIRINNGDVLLSNEVAKHFVSQLTPLEWQSLIRNIRCSLGEKRGQDILYHQKWQISLVSSRYRTEDVVICALVDESTRTQMEISLQASVVAAEQANQAKSIFLAAVSHELRTPLYGIVGNLDLLRTHVLPPASRRLVSAMGDSSDILLKIISDILDFSKIESQQVQIESRDFSLYEALQYIFNAHLPFAVKKKLSLYCFIDPSVPVYLHSDPIRLQQVVANLVGNAIKFTHTGCVMVHVKLCKNELLFSVRDTGIGILTEELPKLFDPFFQVRSNVSLSLQGAGLGLPICLKLIHLMKGKIKVESSPGLGSLFRVWLPLQNASVFSEPQYHFSGQSICVQICNQGLEESIVRFLIAHDVNVITTDVYHPGDDSLVLITDTTHAELGIYRAIIRFSTEHLGPAKENSAGNWSISTAAFTEWVLLLDSLYSIGPQFGETEISSRPATIQAEERMGRILVVDDHPLNCELLSEQLNTLGYQVTMAVDGIDALEKVAQQLPDCILSDIDMPRMTGDRLAQTLRQQGINIPIVAITAYIQTEEKARFIRMGINECLEKPITLSVLGRILRHYMCKE